MFRVFYGLLFFVWLLGGNDSYCRLYIYEFVNSTNGIVGILCRNAWFYLMRMKIKAQVKGYMLALLAGSFVGYCMILPWFHPVLLPNLTLGYHDCNLATPVHVETVCDWKCCKCCYEVTESDDNCCHGVQFVSLRNSNEWWKSILTFFPQS